MLEAAQVVVVEQEPIIEGVTFYSWQEVYADGPKMKGANTVVHIAGGQRQVDSTGRIFNTPHKEVKFVAGVMHSDDPEVITAMRKLIKTGANISESFEAYIGKVAEPARLLERNKQIVEAQARENAILHAENARLTELLKASGRAAKEAKSA